MEFRACFGLNVIKTFREKKISCHCVRRVQAKQQKTELLVEVRSHARANSYRDAAVGFDVILQGGNLC